MALTPTKYAKKNRKGGTRPSAEGLLSIIIIAHNEEQVVSLCLRSAEEAATAAFRVGEIRSFEVILVDAGSTDRTVEIAATKNVKILSIPPEVPHGPGAARYAGFSASEGLLVLFLDGDCVLHSDWLLEALRYIGSNDVAGVDGNIHQAIAQGSRLEREITQTTRRGWVTEARTVETLGQALFRREALDTIGPHDPYLRGGEDRELSQRLRHAGFKLARIPMVSVSHYWGGTAHKVSGVDYIRSAVIWSFGDGQSVRKHLLDPRIMQEQRVRYVSWRSVISYETLLVLAAGMNALVASIASLSIWLALVSGGLLTLLGGLCAMSGKKPLTLAISYTLFECFVGLVRHVSFLSGFLRGVRSPSEFPLHRIKWVVR